MTPRMTAEELAATARIAEARILKVVVSWLFGVATLLIGVLSFMGWQSVSRNVDRIVREAVRDSVVAAVVTATVDSLINAQIAQARVDSLVARRVEASEAKLITRQEPQQEGGRALSLDDPMQVFVDSSNDSTVVLAITVPESAEYEITAVARDDSMFDPVIAVLAHGEENEPVVVDMDDDSGDGYNSLLRVRLEEEIEYELWVAGFYSADSDSVTLNFREVEPDI